MQRHCVKMVKLTDSFLTFNFFFFLDFDLYDPDRVNIKHIQSPKEKKKKLKVSKEWWK